MFGIRKSIDLVSHQNGKRYTSSREYERDLHNAGCDVMTDKSFKELRERLHDERNSTAPKDNGHNHVHIDLRNGKVETSYREIGE